MLEASVEKLLQDVSEDFRAKLFDVQELLSKISLTLKKFDTVYEYTGKKFNVFDILGIGEKEVIICRFMRELLSPFGTHYRGAIFLKPFVKNVLKLDDIPNSELENAEVLCEFVTSQHRRIDIVIKTEKYFIPIEVKIYAGDQNAQIKDYAYEGKTSGKNYLGIYYLTRNGEEPSEKSLCGEKVNCISFKEDITEWLEYCLKLPEVVETAPMRENLLQFTATIKKFTNQTEDDIKMEIIDRIKSSPQNLRAAEEVFSVFTYALWSLKKECFEKVENKVHEQAHIEPNPENKLHYKRFVDKADKVGAGIIYPVSEDEGVRFSYEWNKNYKCFFVGYCQSSGRWINPEWEECIVEHEPAGETIYELCDKAKMEAFTDKCAQKIIELWNKKNNGE